MNVLNNNILRMKTIEFGYRIDKKTERHYILRFNDQYSKKDN